MLKSTLKKNVLANFGSKACSGLIVATMPYMLQLAYGWTSLAFYQNIVAIIILTPLLFLLIPYLGSIGGAIA